MSDLLELLKQFLPIEIAVIAAIFVYLLLLFKGIAEKFISIAEKQTELSETQTQYIQQRLDVVEKYLGISDKAIDLRDKHIQKLEELATQREAEITQSKKSLDEAREQLHMMKQQYQEAIGALDSQSQQVEKVREAQRRLEQASRTEAIENIVHELQTRLQPVMAMAENLALGASSLSTDEIQREATEGLYATLALRTVLMNLRQDMMEFRFRKHSISEIIHEAARMYQAEAVARGLDIRIELTSEQDTSPILEVSRYHLQHAFSNLIHNAIKYSYRATAQERRCVEVVGQPAGRYYSISISNYGVGILPEEIESGVIFEDGYQGKLTKREYRSGVGKGLSVTKHIIERHQGYIKVESKPVDNQDTLEGQPYLTRFVVYLPYEQSDGG